MYSWSRYSISLVLFLITVVLSCCVKNPPEQRVIEVPQKTTMVDILVVTSDMPSACLDLKFVLEHMESAISPTWDTRIAVVGSQLVNGAAVFKGDAGADIGSSSDNCGLQELRGCASNRVPTRFLDYTRDVFLQRDFSTMETDLACRIGWGSGMGRKEEGLESMLRALKQDRELPPSKQFLREEAILFVVFISDGNDCSGGSEEGDDTLSIRNSCEQQRNVEDSCVNNPFNKSLRLEHKGVTRTAYEWCILGDRQVVQEFANLIHLKCPSNGCANQLLPRREVFDEVVALKGDLDLVYVSALVLADKGSRGTPLSMQCGDGIAGYRYELFARMFGPQAQVLEGCPDLATGDSVATAFGRDYWENTPAPDPVCIGPYFHPCELAEGCSLGPFEVKDATTGAVDTAFYRPEDVSLYMDSSQGESLLAECRGILAENCDYELVSSVSCYYEVGASLAAQFVRPFPAAAVLSATPGQ